jgi:hypothetical protein
MKNPPGASWRAKTLRTLIWLCVNFCGFGVGETGVSARNVNRGPAGLTSWPGLHNLGRRTSRLRRSFFRHRFLARAFNEPTKRKAPHGECEAFLGLKRVGDRRFK